MRSLELVPAVEALAGALILLRSIFIALRIRRDVVAALHGKWLLTMVLMGSFVVGYLLFVAALLYRIHLPPAQITGAVFFGGAVFAYIVTRLSDTSIRKISQQDREIRAYAQGLEDKTAALENEVAERKRAEEEARRHLKKLSALHTIDMSISSSLALDVTMNVLLERTVEELSVDAACVLLLDPHTQMLRYFAGRGFRETAIMKTNVRVGQGTVGRAALERRAVIIEDLTDDTVFDRAGMARAEGFLGYSAVPVIAKAQVKGMMEIFHRSRLNPDEEWKGFLNALALQAAIAIDNTTLFDELQRSNVELLIAYDSTLEGWARALELRDEETEGHTQRVVEKTLEMARLMGMNNEQLVHVRRGALLHDIGKMSIPDSVLMKTGPLTEEEMEIMRSHPQRAFELISPIVYLRPALDIPYCHHERWDGTGYPRGLKGEQIPLAARIFAVVDTWDALHNERRYHAPWSRKRICAHISELSETHFDPAVVKLFNDLECQGEDSSSQA